MSKKIIIIILLLIIAILGTISVLIITGVIGKPSNAGTNEDVCKDCVYARYYEEKQIGDTLTDYYVNYNQIDNIKNKKLFLGHKLDSNNAITNGYVCGIMDDEVFCIEGSNDGDVYESNVKVLNKAFGKNKCSESSAPVLDGSGKSETVKSYSCKNDYLYATIYNYGFATVEESKSNGCYFVSSGMYCY